MKPVKSLFRKKKKAESWYKYFTFMLHLWLGLLSSVVLFIVCITGAVYALKPDVERWANRKLLNVDVTGERVLPLDSLTAIFESSYQLTPTAIEVHTGKNTIVSYFKRGEKSLLIYMNPFNGKILGESNKSVEQFFNTSMQLHRWLLMRNPGKIIVGISVLIFIFLLLSGLVLWWPKSKLLLKKGLKIGFGTSGYHLIFQLHRVLGFYSLLALLIISVTGLYFSFEWVRNGLTVTMGGEISHQQAQQRNNQNKKPTTNYNSELSIVSSTQKSIQSHVDQTDQILPYSKNTTIYMPRRPGNGIRIKRYRTDNFFMASVPDILTFAPNGDLEKKEFFSELTLDKKFRAIVKPLHTGELWGTIGSITFMLLALIGASLPVTGFLLWWYKSK